MDSQQTPPASQAQDRPGGGPGGDRPGGDRPTRFAPSGPGDRFGGDRPAGAPNAQGGPGGDRPGGDRPAGDGPRPGDGRFGGERPGDRGPRRYGGRGGGRGGGGGRRKQPVFADNEVVDYKDIQRLRQCIDERGKLLPRRKTYCSAGKQRELTVAVKRARHMALLQFVPPDRRR